VYFTLQSIVASFLASSDKQKFCASIQILCNLVDTRGCESTKNYSLVSSTVYVFIITRALIVVNKTRWGSQFFLSVDVFRYGKSFVACHGIW
jgi:hypothetical protein